MRLGNANSKKVFFVLHCTRLSLYLHNIGCDSAMQIQKKCFLFCIALAFRYICTAQDSSVHRTRRKNAIYKRADA